MSEQEMDATNAQAKILAWKQKQLEELKEEFKAVHQLKADLEAARTETFTAMRAEIENLSRLKDMLRTKMESLPKSGAQSLSEAPAGTGVSDTRKRSKHQPLPQRQHDELDKEEETLPRAPLRASSSAAFSVFNALFFALAVVAFVTFLFWLSHPDDFKGAY
eukprot:c55706_g1_i1.p1 GENE.c55706_g1_i1~~c55706_g1_i1.p1  ORF type:complete len:172 (+),score=36.14 c55706_g1_i1:31-516(+)